MSGTCPECGHDVCACPERQTTIRVDCVTTDERTGVQREVHRRGQTPEASGEAERLEPRRQGCINCGAKDDGGYMTGFEGHPDEGAVGPFCGACWELVGDFFRLASAPPAAQAAATEEQIASATCEEMESVARIDGVMFDDEQLEFIKQAVSDAVLWARDEPEQAEQPTGGPARAALSGARQDGGQK